jgi:hypothetical protein
MIVNVGFVVVAGMQFRGLAFLKTVQSYVLISRKRGVRGKGG